MTGWKTAHIDAIEKKPQSWIPIRDHFGISAFGVNAWEKRESDGQLIAAHDERSTGHEELYYVFRGHARFKVGDEEVDAPAGTIVFVRDPELTRGATPLEDDTLVLSAGGKPGEAFQVNDWELASPYNQRAFPLYQARKYTEAAAIMREAAAEHPELAGVHYNLACFASLAGEKDDAVEHLAKAFELSPGFFEFAKTDSDLDPIRDDPRYPQS